MNGPANPSTLAVDPSQYGYYVKGAERIGKWYWRTADTTADLSASHYSTILHLDRKAESVVVFDHEGNRKTKMVQPEGTLYSGPLYFDIDDEDNVANAIKRAQAVVSNLENYQVPARIIRVWASGKKGFHITVPQEAFSPLVGYEKLAHVYKEMAYKIAGRVKGMDWSVYSTGMGRMWRLAGKKRPDNGMYKVPVSINELRSMTPSGYEALIQTPRPEMSKPIVPEMVPSLAALFQQSLAEVQARPKIAPVFVDPETRGLMSEEPEGLPPCMHELLAGRYKQGSSGFNAASIQFGKGVVTWGRDQAEALVDRWTDLPTRGTRYMTKDLREEHTMGVVRRSGQGYEWSCKSMISVLECGSDKCADCPAVHLLDEVEDDELDSVTPQEVIPQKDTVPESVPDTSPVEEPEPPPPAPLPEQEPESEPEPEPEPEPKPEPEPEPEPEQEPEKQGPALAIQIVSQTGPREVEVVDEELDIRRARGNTLIQSIKSHVEGAGKHLSPIPYDYGTAATIAGTYISNNTYVGIDATGVALPMSNFAVRLTRVVVEKDEDTGFEERVEAEGLLYLTETAYHPDHGGNAGNQGTNNDEASLPVYIDLNDIYNSEGDKKYAKPIPISTEDDSWVSGSTLQKAFGRHGNATYWGPDSLVRRMKSYTFAPIRDIDAMPIVNKVRRVHSIGIHYDRVAGRDVFTYVEPNWSVDNFGNQNTYTLSRTPPVNLSLRRAPELSVEAADEIFQYISHLNEPEVICQQFGYYMAAFLKTHILQVRREFPILGGHGNRGSGKTQGNLRLIQTLHGVDYLNAESEINLPSITPFPLWNAMASSTTVPLVLDEFNKSRFVPPSRYVSVGEYLKMTWQVGGVNRGVLSKKKSGDGLGAETQTFLLTAPIAVLSEQAVELPALVQRMIQVPLKPAGLTPASRKAFTALRGYRDQSQALAKELNMSALTVTVDMVDEWLQDSYKRVPMSIGDRPHMAYSVLFVGYKFANYVAERLGLNDAAKAAIRKMEMDLESYLEENERDLSENKGRSETDLVLETMALLASIPETDNNLHRLVNGIHYTVIGDDLYLYASVCHAAYIRYMRMLGNAPAIESLAQMRALIEHEPYTKDVDAVLPEFAENRKCFRLSIKALWAKGLDIEGFDNEV